MSGKFRGLAPFPKRMPCLIPGVVSRLFSELSASTTSAEPAILPRERLAALLACRAWLVKDEAPSNAAGVAICDWAASEVDVGNDFIESGRSFGEALAFVSLRLRRASSIPPSRSLICSICFSLDN